MFDSISSAIDSAKNTFNKVVDAVTTEVREIKEKVEESIFPDNTPVEQAQTVEEIQQSVAEYEQGDYQAAILEGDSNEPEKVESEYREAAAAITPAIEEAPKEEPQAAPQETPQEAPKSIPDTIKGVLSDAVETIRDAVTIKHADAAVLPENEPRIKDDETGKIKTVKLEGWGNTGNDDNAIDCAERVLEKCFDLEDMGIPYRSDEYNKMLDELVKLNPEIFKDGVDSIIPDGAEIKLPTSFRSKKEVKRTELTTNAMISELDEKERELHAKKEEGGILNSIKAAFGFGTAPEERALAIQRKQYEDAIKSGDDQKIADAYQLNHKNETVYLDENGKFVDEAGLSDEQKAKFRKTIGELSDRELSKYMHDRADQSIYAQQYAEQCIQTIDEGKFEFNGKTYTREDINKIIEQQMNDARAEMQSVLRKHDGILSTDALEGELRAKFADKEKLYNALINSKTPEEYAANFEKWAGGQKFDDTAMRKLLAYDAMSKGIDIDTSNALGKNIKEWVDAAKGHRNLLSLTDTDETLRRNIQEYEEAVDSRFGYAETGALMLESLFARTLPGAIIMTLTPMAMNAYNSYYDEDGDGIKESHYSLKDGAKDLALGLFMTGAAAVGGPLGVMTKYGKKIPIVGKFVESGLERLGNSRLGQAVGKLLPPTTEELAQIENATIRQRIAAMAANSTGKVLDLGKKAVPTAADGYLFGYGYGGLDYTLTTALDENARFSFDKFHEYASQNGEFGAGFNLLLRPAIHYGGKGVSAARRRFAGEGEPDITVPTTQTTPPEPSIKPESTVQPEPTVPPEPPVLQEVYIRGIGKIEAVPKQLENGNMEYTQKRADSSISFETDANGKLIKENFFDKDGNITSVKAFGDSGELIESTSFKYNTNGKPIEEIVQGKDGNITSKTSLQYDANGNLNKKITEEFNNGRKQEIEYDANGDILREIHLDIHGGKRIFEDYQNGKPKKEFVYDTNGKCTSKIFNEYNTNGDLSKKTIESPDGSYREIQDEYVNGKPTKKILQKYDKSNLTEETTKDADGNTISIKSIEYDASGKPAKEFLKDKDGNIISKKELIYDASGKLKNEIETDKTGFTISNTSFEYDANGKLSKKVYEGYDKNGNSINRKEVQYDANGDILREIHLDIYGGKRIFEDYQNGKPTKEFVYDTKGKCTSKIFNEYNTNGDLSKKTIESPDGSYREIQDEYVNGKPTKKILQKYDKGNLTEETIKDADGNIISIKDGNGNPIGTDAPVPPEPPIKPEPTVQTEPPMPIKVNIEGIGEIEAVPEQLANGNMQYTQELAVTKRIIEVDTTTNRPINDTLKSLDGQKTIRETEYQYDGENMLRSINVEYKNGNQYKETTTEYDPSSKQLKWEETITDYEKKQTTVTKFENGKPKHGTVTDKNGKTVGEIEYDADGNIIKETSIEYKPGTDEIIKKTIINNQEQTTTTIDFEPGKKYANKQTIKDHKTQNTEETRYNPETGDAVGVTTKDKFGNILEKYDFDKGTIHYLVDNVPSMLKGNIMHIASNARERASGLYERLKNAIFSN